MTNPRSASNAWAKIKNKLMVSSDGVAPSPKKGSPKKKAVKGDGSDEGDGASKKAPRKRAAKKQDVDGEASPKKRGRPAKKASKEEGEFTLI